MTEAPTPPSFPIVKARNAIRYAVLSAITACVPPGTQSGWQPQPSAYTQPPAYRSQQPTSPDEGDDDYDDAAGGPSNWTCLARGSIGTAQGNGPMLYRTKEWPDTGSTRDEAYLKALRGCNALMGNAANLGNLSGEEVEGGSCTVVDCRPTGT